MKNLIILLAVSFVSLASCSKLSKKSKNNQSVDTMQYTVGEFKDIRIKQFRDSVIFIPIMLQHISGSVEPINFSVNGLPSGVSVISQTLSGNPIFSDTLRMSYYVKKNGVYPVTVNSTGVISGTKTHSFNLIVDSAQCNESLEGKYSGIIENSTSKNTITIVKSNDSNRIQIHGTNWDVYLWGGGFSGYVNCNDRTITIPEHNLGSIVVSGEGNFIANKVFINWKVLILFDSRIVIERSTMTRL